MRLLATELGPLGVRVNGVNPDGVVRGSGIFEGGWGDERAKVYGVSREELGRFYAGRTVLGHEVLPEHVAAAVFALCAGDLALTTGTIVPGRQRGADGVPAVRAEEPTMTIDRSRIARGERDPAGRGTSPTWPTRSTWWAAPASTARRWSTRWPGSAWRRRRGRWAPAAPGSAGSRAAASPATRVEKIDDVAALNALTGANRTVSLHVPWDDPGDERRRAARATPRSWASRFDAMNSNTFQDNPSTTRDGAISYKFGSLANVDEGARRAAIEHNHYVIDLGVELGSTALTVWLADGMNHPGQASFRGQFERVLDGLREIYAHLPDDWELYTEHKPYEPAFYSSVNNDWGTSLLLAQGTGDRAKCLVDLGHHLPNTNIEQVVSRLAMVGRLGGFHFNDSKYGDDDLTVGSITPFQLFLIVGELLEAGGGRDARRSPT